MDKNHHDKAESETLATDDKLWLPPLSSQDQEKLKQLQSNQMEDTIKQLSDRGYKVTEEYSISGQLSKVSGEHPPRKTLWDWLQILAALAIPIAIALGTAWFSYRQNQTSLQVAADRQQEEILKTYLDNMSDLLFNHDLSNTKQGEKVNQLARARTLTALRRLDSGRKGLLIRFLSEAQLIVGENMTGKAPIISLAAADLSGANLSGAALSAVVLSGADLTGADLSSADLRDANLYGAKLTYANLRGANLEGTFLRSADLDATDLRDANLYGASLLGADLHSADLRGAHLDKTILKGARYNTKEMEKEEPQGKRIKYPLTQWPQGFDPKAAEATEENTSP